MDKSELTFGVDALTKEEALQEAYKFLRKNHPSLMGRSSWTFRRTNPGRFQVTVSYRRTVNLRDGE